MSDIPYDEWAQELAKKLHSEGIEDGLVLELGCGTGNLTRRLKALGYDMIGVDVSPDMLAVAREQESEGILYLQQDMREFELYGTVRAVVCLCDGMNYILTEDDLLEVFRLADNYLDPGGLFIFDMKTEHLYRDVLEDRSFVWNREDGSLVWENSYDPDEKLNEYELTVYRRLEDEDLYERFEETHVQRAYETETVTRLLKEAGLRFEGVFSSLGGGEPAADSERIYFVARECKKKA